MKSDYGKSQPVIGGKLFSLFRTVFELAQYLPDWAIPEKIQTRRGRTGWKIKGG